jgi:hypothetical protein
MAEQPLRLDGWKAIAAYVKRDRSTVIRWKQNGLPVRRIPGGQGAAVFAYTQELDAWLARGGATLEVDAAWPAPTRELELVVDVAPAPRRRWPVAALALAAALAMGLLALTAFRWWSNPGPALPQDPAVARLYLQARDDWAARTPESLRSAIAELGEVIRREPRFAPAYAALADAYILSPEFDSVPQGVAFKKAQGAAAAALAIDPGSADANRDLGFVAYWRDHDVKRARGYYARALRAQPQSAQTHFWYGNSLLDNGEVAAGLAELQQARLLEPGSATIETDYAWASWENGSGDEDVAALGKLEARDPQLSTTPYYLALIAFAKGDIAGYLDQAERWAKLQGGADFQGQIAAQRQAFQTGGADAVLDLMAQSPPTASEHLYDGTLWPAGAASIAGRRERMLELLARAEATGERWNPKRWERTLFARWRGDREVDAQLARLFRPQSPKDRLAGPT